MLDADIGTSMKHTLTEDNFSEDALSIPAEYYEGLSAIPLFVFRLPSTSA